MNPNLTANLKAERELKAKVLQEQINQVSTDLDTALKALKWAKRTADVAKLNETHSTFYTAICDAVSATQEAINHINDAPDA
ncbi:MAG TPA: hypothetical protein V6D26_26375 [Stenomitos sp.]